MIFFLNISLCPSEKKNKILVKSQIELNCEDIYTNLYTRFKVKM